MPRRAAATLGLFAALLPACVTAPPAPSAGRPPPAGWTTSGTPRTPAVPVELHAETRPSMATLVTITVAAARDERTAEAVEAAFAVFARVDEAMNEWRPGSPLARLNAAAGSGRLVALPGDLCEVLRAARAGAERTDGLFDPTWAALRGVWRFGDGEAPRVPGDAEVAAACRLVGWRELEIDPPVDPDPSAPCAARLPRTGMQVGLGGIAKGWGVDRAVAELRRRGFRDFTVQAGGDLFASGTRGGAPWRVGLRDPRGGPGDSFATLPVTDAAFSTTGDAERAFVVDGVRYHHVIDTRTCRPATASRQVSVLAPTALEAEVLGKAIFVLGGWDGLELAARSGAAAVIVNAANGLVVSPALSGRLEVARPPTP